MIASSLRVRIKLFLSTVSVRSYTHTHTNAAKVMKISTLNNGNFAMSLKKTQVYHNIQAFTGLVPVFSVT